MDRNPGRQQAFNAIDTSLSARRAWIEITGAPIIFIWGGVALRKESVDRNGIPSGSGLLQTGSLSARRAWIEIFQGGFAETISGSLSARRAWIEIQLSVIL